MKKLIYILFAILLFSCGEDSNPTDNGNNNNGDNGDNNKIDTIEYSLAVIYDLKNDQEMNDAIKQTIEFGINDNIISKMQGYTYIQINLEEYQIDPENGLDDITEIFNNVNLHTIISTSSAITNLIELEQTNQYVLDISTAIGNVNSSFTYRLMPSIAKEAGALINHIYQKGYRNISYLMDDTDLADEFYVQITKETAFIDIDNGEVYEIDGALIGDLWSKAASLNVYLEEEVPESERDKQAVVILTEKDFNELLFEMDSFEFTNNVGFYTYSTNSLQNRITDDNSASAFASKYNLYFPIASNSTLKKSISDELMANIIADPKYSPYILTSFDALYAVYSAYTNVIYEKSTGNNTDFATEFEIFFSQQPAEGVMGSLLMTNHLRDYANFDFYNIKGSENSFYWEIASKVEVIPN